MAIHYGRRYSETLGTRNFGDDVNPFLLERVFSKRLIASETVCIMGIGTIINDRNVAALDRYSTKIIFSSGAGYEELRNSLDSSWRVAWGRGPKPTEMMVGAASKSVCDGAVRRVDAITTDHK